MMRMKHVVRGSAGLAALACFAGLQPAAAQQADEPLDRTPQDCIVVANINRTRVLDDQTILFFMRGRRVFQNHLGRACPGLEREDRFMYEARNSRLCDVDTITVMEDWGGRPTEFGRFSRGFTCPLGDFHPISVEEAAALEAEERTGPRARRDSVESRSVEVPPEEENARETDAADESGDEPPAAPSDAAENE